MNRQKTNPMVNKTAILEESLEEIGRLSIGRERRVESSRLLAVGQEDKRRANGLFFFFWSTHNTHNTVRTNLEVGMDCTRAGAKEGKGRGNREINNSHTAGAGVYF